MKKKTIEKSDDVAALESCERGLVKEFHRALGVLTGKWKGEILWQLVQRKHRFGELRQSIPGVTQHMLTTQLRDLEADGLAKCTVYPEVPPRVEYRDHAHRPRRSRPVFAIRTVSAGRRNMAFRRRLSRRPPPLAKKSNRNRRAETTFDFRLHDWLALPPRRTYL